MDEPKATAIGDLPPGNLVLDLDGLCDKHPYTELDIGGKRYRIGTGFALRRAMDLLGVFGEARGETYMDADGEPQNPRSPEAGGGGHVSFGGLKVTFADGGIVEGAPLVNAPDTREKLEADVRAEYYMLSDEDIAPVFRWLDRQAEITSREWKAYHMRKVNLHRLIERDKRISDLQAENARLQAVVRTQAESFAKLERELAGARHG